MAGWPAPRCTAGESSRVVPAQLGGRNNGSTCLSHDGAVMAPIAEPLILARAETGALIFTFCLFTKKPLKLMIKYFELSDGAT